MDRMRIMDCRVNADKEEIVCSDNNNVQRAFRIGNVICVEYNGDSMCSSGNVQKTFEMLLKRCKELSEKGEQELLNKMAEIGIDIVGIEIQLRF